MECYSISRNLKFIEYDPTSNRLKIQVKTPIFYDYGGSNINYGFEFKYKNNQMKTFYNRDGVMHADFSHSLNFKDYKHIIKNNIAKSATSFKRFQQNAIALKTVSSNADSLKIVIRQNSYESN